jgi:hypothetical protein
MLGLAFTPTPITGDSGRDFVREKWPEIRDALHDLRNDVRHLIHRK